MIMYRLGTKHMAPPGGATSKSLTRLGTRHMASPGGATSKTLNSQALTGGAAWRYHVFLSPDVFLPIEIKPSLQSDIPFSFPPRSAIDDARLYRRPSPQSPLACQFAGKPAAWRKTKRPRKVGLYLGQDCFFYQSLRAAKRRLPFRTPHPAVRIGQHLIFLKKMRKKLFRLNQGEKFFKVPAVFATFFREKHYAHVKTIDAEWDVPFEQHNPVRK